MKEITYTMQGDYLIPDLSLPEQQEVTLTADGLEDMRNDCMDMLQAIIAMLDGAKYLWQGVQIDKEKSPDSGNC